MSQRLLSVVIVIGACVGALSTARAQTATQVVTFSVVPINRVAVTGAPAPLVMNSAVAGQTPASVSAAGGTYAITTNESNKKITASVNQALPAGVSLEVSLAAPDGAATPGNVALGTAASDVVTGISSLNAASLPITYRLTASPNAQVSGAATRTVTFTIVSGT
jgi:hypothetical protein